MLTALISRLMILAFGTLYPAYASYKAVRSKDVKEYVKWMMYWIVFALFTCAETFTDVLFSFWFPFYYEIKVGIVFWLLSPATKGSSFLYRHFVHPAFQKRESEIDEMLNKAKEKGYNTFLSIGTKGVTYATNVILQTAMKGGGGLMDHLRKSYSLTDLSPPKDSIDGDEDIVRITSPRTRRQMSSSTVNMRFQEFDVNMRQPVHLDEMIGDVRSTEDISSGYSSTDQLYTEGVMTRSSSLSSTRGRPRGRGTVRRAPVPEESEDSDNDQWIECTSNVEQAQVSTPQSIPSGANLDFMSSLTSNTASNYQLNDSPSFNDKPSDTLENNLIKVSLEAKEFIHELNIAVNEPEDENVQKTSSQFSINSFGSDRSQDDRKGKYNKLQAPKPPKVQETEPETPPQTKVQETEPETSPQTEANINRPRAEMKFLKFLEFD